MEIPKYTLRHFEDDEYRVAVNGEEMGGTVSRENGREIVKYMNLHDMDNMDMDERTVIPYSVLQWIKESIKDNIPFKWV